MVLDWIVYCMILDWGGLVLCGTGLDTISNVWYWIGLDWMVSYGTGLDWIVKSIARCCEADWTG